MPENYNLNLAGINKKETSGFQQFTLSCLSPLFSLYTSNYLQTDSSLLTQTRPVKNYIIRTYNHVLVGRRYAHDIISNLKYMIIIEKIGYADMSERHDGKNVNDYKYNTPNKLQDLHTFLGLLKCTGSMKKYSYVIYSNDRRYRSNRIWKNNFIFSSNAIEVDQALF